MAYYRDGSEVTLALSNTNLFGYGGHTWLANGHLEIFVRDPQNPFSGKISYVELDNAGGVLSTIVLPAYGDTTNLPDGRVIKVEPSGADAIIDIYDPAVLGATPVSHFKVPILGLYQSGNGQYVSIKAVPLPGNANKIAVFSSVVAPFGKGWVTETVYDLSTDTATPWPTFVLPTDGQGFTVTELADKSLLVISHLQESSGVPARYGFRVLDPAGQPVQAGATLDLQVAAGTPSIYEVVALKGGGFAVLWAEGVFNGSSTVTGPLHVQTFDAKGVAVSANIVVDSYGPALVGEAAIAALDDGSFAVAWTIANTPASTSNTEISVRTFAATGGEIGSQQIVNTKTSGTQAEPDIVANAGGGFTVLWRDYSVTGAPLSTQTFANLTGATFEGTSGADRLTGTDKDDLFLGHGGNDVFLGGAGNDTVSFADASAGIYAAINTTSLINTGAAGSVRFYSIENVIGSAHNDVIYGNADANRLDGGAGNDRLYGGGGADVLLGGAGNDVLNGGTGVDRMEGGAGNDVYAVDDSGDVIVETATGGFDKVTATASYTLSDNVEYLLLAAGAGNIDATGNQGNNTLIGNNGDNVINGKGGVDTLVGGRGHDTFVFDRSPTMPVWGRIKDFTVGEDQIALSRSAFFGFSHEAAGALPAADFMYGTKATHAGATMLYDKATGNLFYDADGLGGQHAVRIATLLGAPDLHASDIVLI